jgi:hypothetical protein
MLRLIHTTTQKRKIIMSNLESALWELSDAITDHPEFEEMENAVPDFIESDISPYTIAGICKGGCASGSYMPAVIYADAIETMSEHGDAVLQYIEDTIGELPQPKPGESWSGMAVFFLSVAVELWAAAAQDELLDLMQDNIDTKQEELRAQFKEHILPLIIEQDSADDEPAINEGWNNWTDGLQTDGQIPAYVCNNITFED